LNKWLKGGLILGTIAGIGFAISKGAKKLGNVSYSIQGFGIPSFSGTVITVPVIIEFNNPTPVPISIDRLQIVMSYMQASGYAQAGSLDQANINLPGGKSSNTFYPKMDVKALFSNVLNTLTTALKNKALKIKADVTITKAGLSVNSTLTKDITI